MIALRHLYVALALSACALQTGCSTSTLSGAERQELDNSLHTRGYAGSAGVIAKVYYSHCKPIGAQLAQADVSGYCYFNRDFLAGALYEAGRYEEALPVLLSIYKTRSTGNGYCSQTLLVDNYKSPDLTWMIYQSAAHSGNAAALHEWLAIAYLCKLDDAYKRKLPGGAALLDEFYQASARRLGPPEGQAAKRFIEKVWRPLWSRLARLQEQPGLKSSELWASTTVLYGNAARYMRKQGYPGYFVAFFEALGRQARDVTAHELARGA